MEVSQPKEHCAPEQPAPSPSSQSKKPSQPLYAPPKRLHGSKVKAQAQGEVGPRPRPRYTDKARKNAKNNKNKAGGAGGGGARSCDHPDVMEEVPAEEVLGNGQTEAEAPSQLEAASPQEENAEEESWDTLFNDDGDCLDPHLLEEVRALLSLNSLLH